MPDLSGFIIIALCVRIQQLATEVNENSFLIFQKEPIHYSSL